MESHPQMKGHAQIPSPTNCPPSIFNFQVSTLHSPLSSFDPPLSNLNSQQSTFNSPPSTLHPPLSTLHFQLATLYSPPSTLHPPLPMSVTQPDAHTCQEGLRSRV
jgi:hypothetical protein